MSVALIVHGGAGIIAAERHELVQSGCRAAALIGWHVLQHNGSALDAVEAAVRALEDNPNYNAGTGSCLTLDGNIEMDAGMMEGHTLNVGAVAGVEHIKNPILLARKVLESPHVLLAGRGAEAFAHEQGMAFCTREDLLTERQYNNWLQARAARGDGDKEARYHRREIATLPAQREQRPESSEHKHGTVGAVALDGYGILAAATSTGGFMNKFPGRIGDSPLVGCGFYADEHAAISCTGYGEDFMRLLIAQRAAAFAAAGQSAQQAADSAIAVLSARAHGKGGLIVIDRQGNTGLARNSDHMAYAYIREDMQEPAVGI